eukprot:Seg6544.1 transcript_id=Seg6544.1/GoldUCD/mRNA.D3Y31 product="hypothetical protein" protein_id=Seg6544.1/GoldUCD/D3Y31
MADVDNLTNALCQLLQMLGVEVNNDARNAIIELLNDVRERVASKVKIFYNTVFISKVSSCMPSTFGMAPEKILRTLESPLISILENFAKNCEIPTLDDMKKLGKQALSCLVIETVGDMVGLGEEIKSSLQATCNYMLDVAEKTGFSKDETVKIVSLGLIQHLLPNAPENVREKLLQSLKQGSEMLFSSAEKKPSIESFFRSLWELSGERYFIDGFKAKADEIIRKMPRVTERVNEFVMKYVGCLLSRYCRGRAGDILLPFICLSIESIIKKGTLRGKEFIGRGVEILYQSIRAVLKNQNIDEMGKLVESIFELLKLLCKEIKDDLKKELITAFDNLKGIAANELTSFYRKEMIPKLSRYINAGSGIPIKKLLQAMDKPVTSILENFVKKCEIPTLDDIKKLGIQALSCLVIETVGDMVGLGEEIKSSLQATCNYMLDVAEKTGFSKDEAVKVVFLGIIQHLLPNAPENVRDTLLQSLKQVSEMLFSGAEKKPSIESFFRNLWELSGGRYFSDGFKAKADEILDKMLDFVDKVAEFFLKHVMPLLAIYCNNSVFEVLCPFIRLSIDIIARKGTIRGRDFCVAGAKTILQSLSIGLQNTKVTSAATDTTVKMVREEVTETVMGKITEKVVVKKTGKVVTAVASKKVTVSASKRMVREVVKGTEKTASNKVVILASKEVTIENSIKVVEDVTTATTKKTTVNFVKTTKQKIVEETTENVAKVGAKTALKECCKAAAISAVVGGVFLFNDLNALEKDYKEERISTQEYHKKKAGRYGEYAGEVIGSGVAGAVTTLAAFTGPAGWSMILAGALVSYGVGYVGRQIACSFS